MPVGFKQILKFAGAAYAGYFIAKKKSLADNLQLSFDSISVDGNILQPIVNINIKAYNPTNSEQSINNIIGKVYMNGNVLVGDVLQVNPQTIRSAGVSIIQIPVNVAFDGIAQTIKQLVSNGTTNYSFVGTINLSGLNVPVKITN
jgi:LEA14-like dessication related protein